MKKVIYITKKSCKMLVFCKYLYYICIVKEI